LKQVADRFVAVVTAPQSSTCKKERK
jgi:hypothetical protein